MTLIDDHSSREGIKAGIDFYKRHRRPVARENRIHVCPIDPDGSIRPWLWAGALKLVECEGKRAWWAADEVFKCWRKHGRQRGPADINRPNSEPKGRCRTRIAF